MKCPIHPDKDTVSTCMQCGAPFCTQCIAETKQSFLCVEHYNAQVNELQERLQIGASGKPIALPTQVKVKRRTERAERPKRDKRHGGDTTVLEAPLPVEEFEAMPALPQPIEEEAFDERVEPDLIPGAEPPLLAEPVPAPPADLASDIEQALAEAEVLMQPAPAAEAEEALETGEAPPEAARDAFETPQTAASWPDVFAAPPPPADIPMPEPPGPTATPWEEPPESEPQGFAADWRPPDLPEALPELPADIVAEEPAGDTSLGGYVPQEEPAPEVAAEQLPPVLAPEPATPPEPSWTPMPEQPMDTAPASWPEMPADMMPQPQPLPPERLPEPAVYETPPVAGRPALNKKDMVRLVKERERRAREEMKQSRKQAKEADPGKRLKKGGEPDLFGGTSAETQPAPYTPAEEGGGQPAPQAPPPQGPSSFFD